MRTRHIVIAKYYLVQLTKAIGRLRKPIERSFEYGYIIEKEFNDITKANEFYDLADELMLQNTSKHVCHLTPNYMKNFCDTVLDWADAEVSAGTKYETLIFIMIKEGLILDKFNICRKCVCIWSIHQKYIIDIRFTEPSEKVDFVMNNHKKYMREVELACAQYNHLADESKKKRPEERISAKSPF
ncbi:hypothetical protein RF11_15495 [Thelohanellus kitauei]|uniref:Uncharacterized protein n=1 Tax=Thelohanellus kitauei TaxID=669202 RepID=A0A0C2MDZ2_THEKT|nr:hypothetical protein RF11_15495 [Thelohanellus kitauei]